jgi:hypothetical protein
MQARIEQLEAQVAQLVARREGEPAEVAAGTDSGEGPQDRRAFLRLAGVGAAGVVGGLVAGGARPAAANDPNDVVRSVNNQAVNNITGLLGSVAGGPILQLENTSSADQSRALLAVANRSGVGTIRADNPAGGGYGVVGNAVNGADFQAFGSGIYTMQPHQNLATTFHRVGDIFRDNDVLQVCIAQGTPGTMRVLASTAAAGSLHVLPSAIRVYDSRPNLPPFVGIKAPLAQFEERVVNATQGGAAPAGATAVMVNLTIVSQSVAGFVSLFRNGVAWSGNSSINWERQGQVIANSAVVAVDAAGLFRARASQPVDIILDVVGYYR